MSEVENTLNNRKTKNIALGGILASVAIVIMCLGGLIPFSTYVCPVLCILVGNIYISICGIKMGWVWYFAVSILSMLIAPDREAAAFYLFLGAYPCVRGILNKLPMSWILKLLYFNVATLASYGVSVYILGLKEIDLEFRELGYIGLIVLVILSNVTFVLLDHLLAKTRKMKRG